MQLNKLSNKILENKQISLLVFIVILLILISTITYIIKKDNKNNNLNKEFTTAEITTDQLSSSSKIDEINKFAKEKYPNSILVLVADNQGQSSVLSTLGEKDKSTGNNNGNADTWMYIYVKNPPDIKPIEDDKSSVFGKYTIKVDQGFIVEVTNNEINLKKDVLYSDLNLYSVNDISDDLKKLSSNDAYQKSVESWNDQIKSYNYSDTNIQDVDLVFQNILYEKPEEIGKEEVKGTWQVNIVYKDESLEQKKRTFFTRVLTDGSVKKGIVYP